MSSKSLSVMMLGVAGLAWSNQASAGNCSFETVKTGGSVELAPDGSPSPVGYLSFASRVSLPKQAESGQFLPAEVKEYVSMFSSIIFKDGRVLTFHRRSALDWFEDAKLASSVDCVDSFLSKLETPVVPVREAPELDGYKFVRAEKVLFEPDEYLGEWISRDRSRRLLVQFGGVTQKPMNRTRRYRILGSFDRPIIAYGTSIPSHLNWITVGVIQKGPDGDLQVSDFIWKRIPLAN